MCVNRTFRVCVCTQNDMSDVAAKFAEAISFHRTLIRTQQVPPAEAIMILIMEKTLRSQLNSQIRRNLDLNDQIVTKNWPQSSAGFITLERKALRINRATNPEK